MSTDELPNDDLTPNIKIQHYCCSSHLSEKTKESKLLVRSFRHIYKVAGLGIATGLSGLLSLSQFQNKTTSIGNFVMNGRIAIEELD